MPNWTANFLTIEGSASDLQGFLDAVRSDDTVFDFNRLNPMPPENRTADDAAIRDWRLRHWGTPRNACNPLIEGHPATGRVGIGFSTAWVPPVPLLRRMIADFPSLAFDCRFQCDDDCYTRTYNLRDVKGG